MEQIRRCWYWLRCAKDVEHHIQSCCECHMYAPPNGHLHTPILRPTEPLQMVEWGLSEPIMDNMNNIWWLVVMVDTFTKWAEVIAIQNTSSDLLAVVFQHEWIDRLGASIQLENDLGAHFNGAPVQQMCDQNVIRPTRTTCSIHKVIWLWKD